MDQGTGRQSDTGTRQLGPAE